MKNIITQFSRIFVGLLFIISGLIKLNDPVGFSYKLIEYFSQPVLNLPFFVSYALAIALFIVIFETALGIMLLIGYRTKFTVWSLLLMIIFFTFLTFYAAYFEVVKDCGCFGDALKLTPWQSFTKDIILLFFILILFFNKKLIKPLFSNTIQNGIAFLSILSCSFMGYWVINHLPLIDFRHYKVGTNILEGMTVPKSAPKAVVEMIFVYKVNGVNTEFTEKQLMSIPDGATFVERKDKVIKEGFVPPIHDFSISSQTHDYAFEYLSEPALLMITAYDLTTANEEALTKLESLAQKATFNGYNVVGITGSSQDEIAAFKLKYRSTINFFFCDGTTVKTIERANPSFILFKRGTIVQKVHYNDIDKLKF